MKKFQKPHFHSISFKSILQISTNRINRKILNIFYSFYKYHDYHWFLIFNWFYWISIVSLWSIRVLDKFEFLFGNTFKWKKIRKNWTLILKLIPRFPDEFVKLFQWDNNMFKFSLRKYFNALKYFWLTEENSRNNCFPQISLRFESTY